MDWIPVPRANNNLGTMLLRSAGNTFVNRAPGQPLFTQDLNYHCFDPNKTFVLNPAAWSDPAGGQFGISAPFYNDYGYQRRPDEQLSLGRTFKIREGMSFQIRGEFFNIFNRTEVNNPTGTNAAATAYECARSDYGRVRVYQHRAGSVRPPQRSDCGTIPLVD
jgi:hypothetical protein